MCHDSGSRKSGSSAQWWHIQCTESESGTSAATKPCKHSVSSSSTRMEVVEVVVEVLVVVVVVVVAVVVVVVLVVVALVVAVVVVVVVVVVRVEQRPRP